MPKLKYRHLKHKLSAHIKDSAIALKATSVADAVGEVQRRGMNKTNSVDIRYEDGAFAAFVSNVAEASGPRRK